MHMSNGSSDVCASNASTRPSTEPRPAAIQASASRREQRPARAMTLAMRSPLSCVVMTAPSGCGGDKGAEDGAVARADGELRVPLHAEAEAVAGRLDALDHAVGDRKRAV